MSVTEPGSSQATKISRLKQLELENEELRARLADAEEKVCAIEAGNAEASYPRDDQTFAPEAAGSERPFHELADSIFHLVWMANADGSIFWYNRRWFEYTGTSPAEMEGNGWESVHDPNELPKIMKVWKAAIESGEPFEMTFPLRGADGAFRPFLSRGIPVKDAEGKVVRWFGTNTDLSEQQQVEDALRQSESLARARFTELAAILDAVPAITFIAHDPQCRRMTTSRAAAELLRTSQFRAIWDGRVLSAEELPVQIAAATGQEVRNAELKLVFDNGRVRYIFGDAVPLSDDKGNPRGAVGVFIDITKLKEAERALMRSEKLAATGRLAATIAHEINNPLEAVTNLLYLIGNEPDPATVRKFVNLATAELGRVSHITRQTLGFYRDALAPQPLCLTDVLDGVVSLYAREFQKRKVGCEKRYRTPGEIYGFAGELRQVFSNLIQNALDVAPQGGTIRIFTKSSRNEQHKGVSVFITDNGPGISRENKARIFEPFFTTKGQNGTGLGLWVAKDLVQKHGGKIGVRSSVLPSRRGTCFWIFIPITSGEAARA